MSDNEKQKNILQEVRQLFTAYLEKNGQRRTSERYTILEEIYLRSDHFDAEELYVHLRNRNFNISRATVYNTLELLVASDLVTKHQFGKNQAQFEKSYGYKQHDHIICIDCRKVVEFCDPRIQQIQAMVGEILNFKITHHSLNLYGICGSCQIKRSKKEDAK
ncbi:MAG: transcriptional repressor [Chitinophagales bacterium]|nr:transcriptional repressor [Bacteroidota bacterium]MCB9043382.1 transcriptional repressor [Chitinophagales bacterium]